MKKKKTIAVVEDEEMLSGLMSDEFRRAGFNVIQAFDGEEGLKLVQSEKPDLVLTDVMMPKIDGVELLKRLKADDATKNIPVIILTAMGGTGSIETVTDVVEMGAEAYMVKGAQEVEEIVKVVKKVLEEKSFS